MRYCINGLFLTQRLTGVQRYAIEIVRQLDKIVPEDYICIACPKGVQRVSDISLDKIGIVEIGPFDGIPWEQTTYALHCVFHRLISVNLCNTIPILSSGIMCIHDIAYKSHPEFFTTFYGKLSSLWHSILFHKGSNSKYPIITVSEFSKNEIINEYGVSPERIWVIGNAWQHIMDVKEDESVLERCDLVKKQYYFSLGNISVNKNLKWINENAKENPETIYVVSGNAVRNHSYNSWCKNVKYVGYVSDGELKTLMMNCKAFIFPSLYEGFGIPPLEALSLGANVVVSKIPPMLEIFSDAAVYIDPENPKVALDELLQNETKGVEEVLRRYSWESSGAKLMELLKDYENTNC